MAKISVWYNLINDNPFFSVTVIASLQFCFSLDSLFAFRAKFISSPASTHTQKKKNIVFPETSIPQRQSSSNILWSVKRKTLLDFSMLHLLQQILYGIMSLPSWNPSSSPWAWLPSWPKDTACSRWADSPLDLHRDSTVSVYEFGFYLTLQLETIPSFLALFACAVGTSLLPVW